MRVAQKYSDPNLMKLAQELGGSQPMEGTAMSEKQSDIVERLSLSSDPEKLEAADEIETLRALLVDQYDEIERLRAALRKIIAARESRAPSHEAFRQLDDAIALARGLIARAALKGKL